MTELRIIKGDCWYSKLAGKKFPILGFSPSLGFLVLEDEFDTKWYVKTSDCEIDVTEVVEKPKELLIKLIPNCEGNTVDFPTKLPQGDWIDLRVLDGTSISICHQVLPGNSYPVLDRCTTKRKLHWRKGILEDKEVMYTPYDKGDFLMLDLATAMKLPKGYEAHVIPRSSLFKNTGLIQTNGLGLIDNSYCSETDVWKMPVYALEDGFIIQNERICQFRIQKNQPELKLTQVESLLGVDRGGFGEGTKHEK